MSRRRTGLWLALSLCWTCLAAGASCTSVEGDGVGRPEVDDASGDSARRDGPVVSDDGGAGGRRDCTAVKGPCDLVVQDCADDEDGQKQECVVARTPNARLTTQCVPVQPSQLLPLGRSCCPGDTNPCLPGLSCVGDPCVDGAQVTARCAPACCEDDHASCGRSEPEGIGGRCDLTLFVGDEEVHRVCSYRERCRPFGVEPCGQGKTCIVEDKVGTGGCISSNGIQNRQPCKFANDCADGYICVGPADAAVCRMFCLTPNSLPPFDASAATGEPGLGGCPAGETCTGPGFQNLPDWLQLCELPDGG